MILVTGATGILGRVIVLELLKRGKIVRAAKRRSSNLEEVRHSFQFYTENPDDYFNKIEWMNVDFEDIHSLQNALIGVEEVYHCAATVSFHPADQTRMYHTNIEGTKNLLFACEGSGVKKFCFVSSIAVLDGVNEKDETDETDNVCFWTIQGRNNRRFYPSWGKWTVSDYRRYRSRKDNDL